MKIVELAKLGYEFRQRSTANFGACVTLCGNGGKLIDIFFRSTTRGAMEAARKKAITDFVERKLR
jgi:hypothetical protein